MFTKCNRMSFQSILLTYQKNSTNTLEIDWSLVFQLPARKRISGRKDPEGIGNETSKYSYWTEQIPKQRDISGPRSSVSSEFFYQLKVKSRKKSFNSLDISINPLGALFNARGGKVETCVIWMLQGREG